MSMTCWSCLIKIKQLFCSEHFLKLGFGKWSHANAVGFNFFDLLLLITAQMCVPRVGLTI